MQEEKKRKTPRSRSFDSINLKNRTNRKVSRQIARRPKKGRIVVTKPGLLFCNEINKEEVLKQKRKDKRKRKVSLSFSSRKKSAKGGILQAALQRRVTTSVPQLLNTIARHSQVLNLSELPFAQLTDHLASPDGLDYATNALGLLNSDRGKNRVSMMPRASQFLTPKLRNKIMISRQNTGSSHQRERSHKVPSGFKYEQKAVASKKSRFGFNAGRQTFKEKSKTAKVNKDYRADSDESPPKRQDFFRTSLEHRLIRKKKGRGIGSLNFQKIGLSKSILSTDSLRASAMASSRHGLESIKNQLVVTRKSRFVNLEPKLTQSSGYLRRSFDSTTFPKHLVHKNNTANKLNFLKEKRKEEYLKEKSHLKKTYKKIKHRKLTDTDRERFLEVLATQRKVLSSRQQETIRGRISERRKHQLFQYMKPKLTLRKRSKKSHSSGRMSLFDKLFNNT